MEPIIILFAIAVVAIIAVKVSRNNAEQKKLENAYIHQQGYSVPTKLTAPQVARKYAPGFCDVVGSLRIVIIILSVILCGISVSYFDEEVMIFVIIAAIVLNIMIFINYGLACLFFRVAVDKGYTSQTYIAVAFWLGAIGYLLIAALPNTYANVPEKQQTAHYTQPAQPVQAQPVQAQQPVQQVKTPPAPDTPPANAQIGRCLQCGAMNVPLQNVSVNISGVQRTRAVCGECAAKYNQ